MKTILPVIGCVAGLLYCSWRVHQARYAAPHYRVEVLVHGPDGDVIPIIRHR